MKSPSRQFKKDFLKKVSVFFLALLFVFPLFFFTAKPSYAGGAVAVTGSVPETITNLLDKIKDILGKGLKKAGSALLQSTLRSTLNTLAYEAANKVGAGMTGQKPMYETKSWKDIMNDTGDAALGGFIDSLDSQWGVNVCEPDLAVKLNIGLGLRAQSAPPKPNCDWNKLKKNWDSEKLKEDFLSSFSNTFNPTSNDLGIALTLQTGIMEDQSEKARVKSEELSSKKGWLDLRNIGEEAAAPPDNASDEEREAYRAKQESFGKVTGDIFVDAANIFLNQLALTAYKGIMANLTEKSKGGGGGLADANADPGAGGGAAGLRKGLSPLVETRFDSRGDYDILGELAACEIGPGGVGPTNCVIDDRFSQAIQQKKTVGQALKEGLLKKDAPFGFQTSGIGAIEPGYLEGVPYRSMLILRKFRIIPVGWELAAQKIYGDLTARQNAYLGKMVECYSKDDAYEGYWADWCNGLVDPDWVLKAPQNYCAKEGYGPQILFQRAVDQGIDQLTFEEDLDGDGWLDVDEDINNNGQLDEDEDLVQGANPADGRLDVDEDTNNNGQLDEVISVNKPSKWVLNRIDTYCADEQSCIKEKNDGSCEYYGYCTEERRKWNFGQSACEPVNNSCEAFKNESGSTFAYLKNTLDFCSAEDYGCERYAKADIPGYNSQSKKMDWSLNGGYSYFNKGAQECDPENEGCHEFLRIRAGLGTNLVRNSGFESNSISDVLSGMGEGTNYLGLPSVGSAAGDRYEAETVWPVRGSDVAIVDNAPNRGGNVLRINSSFSPAGLQLPDRSSGSKKSVLPQGFVMEPETSYTLSADVYNVSADRVVLMIGRDSQYWERKEITIKNSWTRAFVTIKNNADILADEAMIFGFNDAGGRVEFYIDNVKFEVGNKATAYNDYRQSNLVYQKLLPSYLEGVCYQSYSTNNYVLKANAPAECRNYARKCNRDEANCEMFTPVKGGANLPAAVTDKDYCLAECNGFDAYVQTKNDFNSRQAFYFIPKTAASCSLSQVGCEEFTNLDKSEQGGESREYYSYFRQCVKPNTPGNSCAAFYTWDGNNESGEQIVKHDLKADASGDVALTSNDSRECNEVVFSYDSGDLRYNPDCRRFTNQAGVVSYHLYSRTISCTDDCHPYRMSHKNVNATSSSACIGSARHWDSAARVCNYCENGGYWSDEHNACIYNAAPQESVSCSASANGCAEFNGNQGNNVRQLFISTFENGNDGWSNVTISGAAVSGKSSAMISSGASISKTLGQSVSKGKSYAISFVARPISTAGSVMVSVRLENDFASDRFLANAEKDLTVEVKPNQWGVYRLNLASLNHNATSSERLVIAPTASIYIDNIQLSVISERYYLIRDSWKTPNSCNQDENGKPYPLYMLGCAEYKDRLGNTHYLHRFSRLCQESAVGCEAIIDSQNSTKQASEYFSTGVGTLVPADRVIYAVYDPNKKCASTAKGCERFGLAKEYDNSFVYSDVFIKNDPDKYSSILCSEAGVGCDKWTSAGGDFYFKDPGDMVCEWRIGKLPGKTNPELAWFKKKVKRCNGDGTVCSSDQDCAPKRCQSGASMGAACVSNADCPTSWICREDAGASALVCKLETTEDEKLACPVSSLKTFGQGGSGNEVYQPAKEASFNWVGLCSADQSSCTEYIDPVSDFSANLVYNYDFKQNIGSSSVSNGWISQDSKYAQTVFLEGGNLYVFALEGSANSSVEIMISSAINRPFYVLNSYNKLGDPVNSVSVAARANSLFYADRNTEVSVFVSNAAPNIDSKVILRKAVIDYQLASKVDKVSCSNGANLGEGCVYFNERSVIGSSGLKPATKNSWFEYGLPVDGVYDDANEIIKVEPDRTCNQWLSCKTYVKGDDNKPVCFGIAECNRLDAGGNCVNFVAFNQNQKDNRVYDPMMAGAENPDTIKNLSGYVKVGYPENSPRVLAKNWLPSNYLSFGLMRQDGEKVEVPNGNFEVSSERLNEARNGYVYNPLGWSAATLDYWSSGLFQVIKDPVTAQKAGVSYPAEGESFLQYSPGNFDAFPISDAIRLTKGKKYYLSFKINTNKLIGTNATATIEILRGDSARGDSVIKTIEVEGSLDWTTINESFDSDTSIVRLRLGASGSLLGGYIYVDDFKITPVLKTREEAAPWNVPQTCRLYPREDSLSCDYQDDAGMRLKGDWGYCLEYDRAPGNPDACLLWWPIDKVSGQGEGKKLAADQVKSYQGTTPLFYCVAGNTQRPYIEASESWYAVDETMQLQVNGVNVTRTVGYDGSSGPTNVSFVCNTNDMPQENNGGDLGLYYEALMFNCESEICEMDTAAKRKTLLLANVKPNFFSCSQGSPDNNVNCIKKHIRQGTAGQSGVLSNALDNRSSLVSGTKIYLNHEVNTVTFKMASNHGGGVTYGLLAGRFYYWGNDGVGRSGIFNLTDQGSHKRTRTNDLVSATSNGSTFNPTQIIAAPDVYHGGNTEIKNCRLRLGSSDSINIPDFLGGGKAGTGKRNYFVPESSGNDDGTCESGDTIDVRSASFQINIPSFGCNSVAQVVDRNGNNKAWTERIKESSGYKAWCNVKSGMPNFVADPYLYNNAEGAGVSAASSTGNCSYTADASPYGSIIPPTGSDVQMMSPSEWGELNDGNPADNANKSDNFPLFYSESGARMGQLYNSSTLSYLFAESYGVWDWNSAEGTYVMNPTSTLNWSSPSNLCDKNIRTVDNPNCAVRPELNIYDVATERYKNSIKLNGGDNAQILGRGFVNLTFNSKVDSEQAPLTMYEIDWGDDEKLIVSGADMKEMPNESNPHSAFHAYDYWDLYGKYQDDSKRNDMPTLFCGTKNNVDYCSVKPKVKIKDNWGWCSEGRTGVACPVPASASCVDGNGNVGASNPYCRDYVASGYRVLSRVCPSSYRYCSDGYYESVGEVLVYNYAAR